MREGEEDGNCDFVDYLILQHAKDQGCRILYIIDKKFSRADRVNGI